MDIKFPKAEEKDGLGKASAFLQLVCFAAMFLGIYLPLRRVVSPLFFRILILIGDYIVVSLVTFLVIKPLFERIESALRKKK